MLGAATVLPMPAAGLTVTAADASHTLPLPDHAVDIVWIGDYWSTDALPEIRRVLRPRGRMVVRRTGEFSWLPADDPAFRSRIDRAVSTGFRKWLAHRGGRRDPLPTNGPPGWQLIDTWTNRLTWTAPLPELVEEYLLQDFATFHGRFIADAAALGDWERLCRLMDPASPEYLLRRSDLHIHWEFDYLIFELSGTRPMIIR